MSWEARLILVACAYINSLFDSRKAFYLLTSNIGWLLKVIMGHLTEKSSGVLTVRFRPNVPLELSALRNYLQDKDLGEQEVGIESKQQIKKVSWTDDDNVSFFSLSAFLAFFLTRSHRHTFLFLF